MKNYIQEVIKSFDMENVFKTVKEKNLVDIPEDVKGKFIEFYSEKRKEIVEIYQEIFNQRKKGDDEICI